MRELNVFISLSLDGCFVDAGGDMSWAHQDDEEWNAFVAGNAGDEGELLLGRVTYDLMAGFWPTPSAAAMMPEVAARMNAMTKHVASRTLDGLEWRNARLVEGELVEAVRRMKAGDGPPITILGSGQIVAQLADAGLVDSFEIALLPLALGGGRSPFQGLSRPLRLKPVETRCFANGTRFLRYAPERD